jgi:hypothetical protein
MHRSALVRAGHDDRVATSVWVGYEIGKAPRHYSKLVDPDLAQFEWFDGLHMIHGVGFYKSLNPY